ncbi:MAG: hypothetical protein H0X66_06450 [Verrucomicrobia bacterium]|nr:hypothetical protein [Verrucomicrobiota bacterium]
MEIDRTEVTSFQNGAIPAYASKYFAYLIYDYLIARGYTVEGEYIVVQGWQVQSPPTLLKSSEAELHALNQKVMGQLCRSFRAFDLQ